MFLRAVSALSVPLAFGTACLPAFDADTSEETAGETDASDTEDPSGDSDDTGEASTGDSDFDPADCHPADPMMSTGWTRTYDVVFRGTRGTERQRGVGPGAYTTVEQASGAGWSATVHIGCDDIGRALQSSWEGSVRSVITGGPVTRTTQSLTHQVRATPSVPAVYLPSISELRRAAEWEYAYDLRIEHVSEGTPFAPFDIPVSGTYTVSPETRAVTIGSATYQAFHITHEFTQDLSGMGALGIPVPPDVLGHTELWYVEGLGLVRESTTDRNASSLPVIDRTLVSYSGLTPVR